MTSINRNCLLTLVVMLSMAVLSIEAATFTVSKTGGGGQFQTVQAAIDKAGPGDIVKILDVATYAEQVTIDSLHNNLTLTSANPTALNKPRIVWNDRVNVKPQTCVEAQNDALMTFDQNGALRLMWAHGVIVNGIAIDGGGVFPFVSNEAVWNGVGQPKTSCTYYLQQGNAALDLYVSGDIIVKNCDIGNAFIGIDVKDRNSGGIFANANPGDNTPWAVVPLSGFARTGNHLIEHNRIHDNSYGFWCESIWDLGSTIRYNRIFNNHNPDSLATKIRNMPGTENTMMCGGAFFFKDNMYTPFAIYNNTFWHNFLIFEADWRPGAQHLVFNNIYGTPYRYWTLDPVFTNNESNELSPKMTYRMNNCVYSIQNKAPSSYNSYSVAIMNGITVGKNAANFSFQGELMDVNQGFPATANIRWVEMDTARFLSVNPASSQFLEPKWSDSLVNACIKDAGWVASGVVDPDGTPADLGAIPSGGVNLVDDITIKPIDPISFTGTAVNLRFEVTQRIGSMTNPKITLFRYVKNLPNQANSYGTALPILAANIITVPVPATPVKIGVNQFNVTIPGADTSTYSFFELTITGTGSDGKPVSASVGFIPYRKLDYKFVVQVWNYARTSQPDTVHAGDSVWIKIIPMSKENVPFDKTVNPAKIWLQSGFNLFVPGTQTPVTLPAGVAPLVGTERAGMFTKVPQGNIEYVHASGQWTSGTNSIVFLDRDSKGIVILSGPAEKVVFQNPPSKSFGALPPIVNKGSPFPGTFKVYDKWGNSVNSPASVTLKSLSPLVGNIVGDPKIATTDATGTGTFEIIITSGTENQSFWITGNLPGKNLDSAEVTVGKPLDRLWIFYSDTAAYAPATLLQGQVGDRLKITVMVGKSALLNSITNFSTSFTINGSAGLVFYDSLTAVTPSTSFTLVNGRVDLWVTSPVMEIKDGSVTAFSDTNLVVSSDPRAKIFFIKPLITIDSAFYYADNFGRVNKAEVYYKDTIAVLPDSMEFFWPERVAANRKFITGSAIVMAPDKKHLTITLPPFPEAVTSGSGVSQLGTAYQKATVGATDEETTLFTIKERVGPLVMTAAVVERLSTGVDTLYVTFSENLKAGSLVGASLVLIQNGTSSVLTVDNAVLNGTTYKLTLAAGSVQPQVNDSLRINPAGPLADALGNTAHLNNRPVAFTVRSIPASITAAFYFDRNADGTVETVVMKFNKKVTLSDLVVALDWGDPVKIDSIDVARLSFQGADNTTIEINTLGVFPALPPGPRTSGGMNATVGYRSVPDKTAGHTVADSAAPVLVWAQYAPDSVEKIKDFVPIDTLKLKFSEDLGPLAAQISFPVLDVKTQSRYTIVVNTTRGSPGTGVDRKFIVDRIDGGVSFPRKGDSIWIDTASHISDIQQIKQMNLNNGKVMLDVLPVPYGVDVVLSQNPFVPGTPISKIDGINGRTGIAIEIAPDTQMKDSIKISANGRIYDIMGNLIMEKSDFQKNIVNNRLFLTWDGRNRNGRYVGTGTYLALVSVTKDNKISEIKKIKIGVKR